MPRAACPGHSGPTGPQGPACRPGKPDGTRGSARTRQRAPCPEGTAGWTPAPSLSSHGVLFLPQCHRLLPAFLLRSVSSVAGCPQPGPLPRSRVRGGAQTPARPERPGPEDMRGGLPITGCHSAGGGTPGPRRRPAWTVRPASPWETWAAAQAALVPPSDGRREASWPTRPVINGVCPPLPLPRWLRPIGVSRVTNDRSFCGVFLSERPWQEGLPAPPPGPPPPAAPAPSPAGAGSAETDTAVLGWESPRRRGQTAVWGPRTSADGELLSPQQWADGVRSSWTWVEERASGFFCLFV